QAASAALSISKRLLFDRIVAGRAPTHYGHSLGGPNQGPKRCAAFLKGLQVRQTDRSMIDQAEREAAEPTMDFMATLRRIPLESFAELLLQKPCETWPVLSRRLPAMAPEELQQAWNGTKGADLMRQTVAFAKLLDCVTLRYTGSGLLGKTILDYGCGWGR